MSAPRRWYWDEGYLSGGEHIICSRNEGVTFHVSFQNQYLRSHTNSMLGPLKQKVSHGVEKRGMICLMIIWQPHATLRF